MHQFWLTLFSAGAGAFLAQFAAAFVKAKVGQGRYVEKCRDADLEALNSAVDELLRCSCDYYSTDACSDPHADKMQTIRIRALFTQITGCMYTLYENNKVSSDAANVELKPIYRKITGDQFGDPDRLKDYDTLGYVQNAAFAFKTNNIRRRRKMKRSILAD